MARAKVKNLDAAIDRLFKQYNSNLKKAMEDAAKKAEEDIMWEAKSCLYRYYENYDPNWYDRTDSLIQAFVPVNEVIVKKKENEIVARAGVMYDPSRLVGVYWTEGSDNDFFNPVNATWVLQNYLAGIHPRTNGYPWYNLSDGEVIYRPIQDAVSPDDTMKKYIENYKETFSQNVFDWFLDRVTRR
jgi:hypothetical protein